MMYIGRQTVDCISTVSVNSRLNSHFYSAYEETTHVLVEPSTTPKFYLIGAVRISTNELCFSENPSCFSFNPAQRLTNRHKGISLLRGANKSCGRRVDVVSNKPREYHAFIQNGSCLCEVMGYSVAMDTQLIVGPA